jgi:hypothetical protein
MLDELEKVVRAEVARRQENPGLLDDITIKQVSS